MDKNHNELSRRQFLRRLGIGSASALSLMALGPLQTFATAATPAAAPSSPRRGDDAPASGSDDIKMTYRRQNGSGENISLLGFGMMRLPREQEEVNRLVDYAIAHGVNYFDTAPMYGGGRNEAVTGAALSRHPREKYYVATKMSNQNQQLWSFGKSKEMYENSFRQLRVDYIDYYLLHSIGGGGMDALRGRFIDNGLLDFLVGERQAGRIRHLGFSYHGDVRVFDYLLDHHDEYHWDFVQIQMNYVDWRHAGRGRRRSDADAEYLYGRLEKLGIQAVVMEPIRGGGLANVADDIRRQLAEVRPDDSPATWGFRWVGSFPNILTTLSGMNRMEHLEENVRTFSPLQPCSDAENQILASIADQMAGFPTIGCTTCAYCMPCPYGVDIPGNFAFYNAAVTAGQLPLPAPTADDYGQRQEAFIAAYREALPAEKRATACTDCGQCLSKCPQQIRIPNQMSRLVELTRKRRA
ncbi:MAG: aldo/keto reductase [Bacteroidaceae bacterium]|nr:aldo/keto reductase [Bacteroidaceae bacterium]